MWSVTIVYCIFATKRVWNFQKHLLFLRFFLLNSTGIKHTKQMLGKTYFCDFDGNVEPTNEKGFEFEFEKEDVLPITTVPEFVALRRLLSIGLTSHRVNLQITFGTNLIIFCILCTVGLAIGHLPSEAVPHWGNRAFCLIVSLVALWEVFVVSSCALEANDVLKTHTLVVLRDWHEHVWLSEVNTEVAADIDRAIQHFVHEEPPISFYGVAFTRQAVGALLLSCSSMLLTATGSYVWKIWTQDFNIMITDRTT